MTLAEVPMQAAVSNFCLHAQFAMVPLLYLLLEIIPSHMLSFMFNTCPFELALQDSSIVRIDMLKEFLRDMHLH